MPGKNTVSQERIWMKHYSDDVRNAEPPKMKIYSFLKDVNKNRLQDTAIYYYGAKITIKKFIELIDECADAFAALGVKCGDTVSMVSASIPESIMALYALNKIGATVNAIDPRMDKKSIARMINGCGSEILVAIDIAYPKIAQILSEINQKHIIVQSPYNSLPPVKRLAVKMVAKTQVPFGKRGIMSWETFIKGAKNGVAVDKELIRIGKLAKIEKHFSFHSARHTNATLLMEKGAKITTVQKLLGHRSISTTQIYSQILESTLVNDLKKCSKINV